MPTQETLKTVKKVTLKNCFCLNRLKSYPEELLLASGRHGRWDGSLAGRRLPIVRRKRRLVVRLGQLLVSLFANFHLKVILTEKSLRNNLNLQNLEFFCGVSFETKLWKHFCLKKTCTVDEFSLFYHPFSITPIPTLCWVFLFGLSFNISNTLFVASFCSTICYYFTLERSALKLHGSDKILVFDL